MIPPLSSREQEDLEVVCDAVSLKVVDQCLGERKKHHGLARIAYDFSVASAWSRKQVAAAVMIANHEGLDPMDNGYLRTVVALLLLRADSCARWAEDFGALPDFETEGELPQGVPTGLKKGPSRMLPP